MKNNILIYLTIFVSTGILPACAKENAPALISNKSIAPRVVEWTDLMPAEDLQLLESMKPIDHNSLSKKELANDKPIKRNSLRSPNQASARQNSFNPDDPSQFEASVTAAIEAANRQANEKPQKRTWKDALVSTRVRPEFNNIKIKIGGYIVPLEYDNNQLIKTFFLVPYFGACIHVPPPPPNQIIYVRSPKSLHIHDIYTPYSVTGVLHVETVEKDIGMSSYSLDSENVVVYKDE